MNLAESARGTRFATLLLGAITALLVCLSLGHAVRIVGGLPHCEADALSATELVLGCLLLRTLSHRAITRPSFLPLLGLFACAVLVVPTGVRCAVIALAVWSSCRAPGGGGELPERLGRRLSATALALAVIMFLRANSVVYWYTEDACARGISRVLAFATGQAMDLGATALSLPLVLAVIIASCLLSTTSVIHYCAIVVATVCLVVAGVAATPDVAPLLSKAIGTGGHQGYNYLDLSWAGIVGLAIMLASPLGASVEKEESPTAFLGPVVLGVCIVVGLGLSAVGHAGVLSAPSVHSSGLRVLVHDSGYLDIRVPDDSAFGARASGMFGGLEENLRGIGCTSKRADLNATDDLSTVDVVIIINLIEPLTPAALRRIRTFVAGGGGLLILGDHTGYKAIREPFNEILEGYGIQLHFDAALPRRKSWLDGIRCIAHSITEGIKDETRLQIWTGASLECHAPAYPLVIGVDSYSDHGDISNTTRGYLGNYHWTSDERLGDLILVAAAEPDQGRLLVFGDTSPFQNTAFSYTGRFTRACLNWLGHAGIRERGRLWNEILLLSGAMLTLGAGIVVIRRGCHPLWATPIIVGVWASGLHTAPQIAHQSSGRPLALVDVSHCTLTPKLSWCPDCYGGLQNCLMRIGYDVVIGADRADLNSLDAARVVIVLPPGREMNDSDLGALDKWINAGGTALFCVGYPESENCTHLLRYLGASVGVEPLGSATTEVLEHPLRFHSASPISAPSAITLAAVDERPVMVKWDLGLGHAILVGDSGWLLNSNLEDETLYIPQNYQALRMILESTAGACAAGEGR